MAIKLMALTTDWN